MPRRRLIFACASTSLLALAARQGEAQWVTVTAVRASTSHDLLQRPTGFGVSLAVPIWRRVDVSIVVQRLTGEASGVGIVCAGLIDPDRCPVEPFGQEGRVQTVGIGAAIAVMRARHIELVAAPHLLVGTARSSMHGLVSGNELPTDKSQVGVSATLEARVMPAPRLPVGLVVGGALGRLGPTTQDLVVDGYTPFERWYTIRSVYVGGALSWSTRRDRR
jgi:hypothetical protein